MNALNTFSELSQRGCKFLGCSTPIMGGAMSWVSECTLVAALSNAGAFGVIACGSMSPDLLDAEVAATKALTSQPFGVNLINIHPQLDELAQVCINHSVSHIVIAGGFPSASLIKTIRTAQIKLLCFAPTLGLAQRLVRMGVDALIIEGHEAGGHIGPVSTAVLVQEILPEIQDVPIFVAGGIARGSAIAHYLAMGAAGVQMGTRFVCAAESIAHNNFKHAFIQASARDAVVSQALDKRFPVIPVRALANKGIDAFINKQKELIAKVNEGKVEQKIAQLEIERFWAGALRRAVIDGDVETGSVMAGQSVGMIKNIEPIHTILENLETEARASL